MSDMDVPVVPIDFTGEIVYAEPADNVVADDPDEYDTFTISEDDVVVDPDEIDDVHDRLSGSDERFIVAQNAGDATEFIETVLPVGMVSAAHGEIVVDDPDAVSGVYEVWVNAVDGRATPEVEVSRSGYTGMLAFLFRAVIPGLSPRQPPEEVVDVVSREVDVVFNEEIIREMQEEQAEEYGTDDAGDTPGAEVGSVRCEPTGPDRVTYNVFIDRPFLDDQP